MLNIIFPILLLFLFGLALGSFLNCVIYRLHKNQSFFGGRSFCPQCRHWLAWYDLIPLLSFILLDGKCRYCAGKISWQYPIIEIITAVLVLMLYLKLGFQFLFHPDTTQAGVYNFQFFFSLLSLIIFTGFLIVIFTYDLKYYLIPDKISLSAFVAVLLIQIFNFTFVSQNKKISHSLISLGLAVLIGGGFFLAQFILSNGKWIGGGDIRLGVLMGLMLSWPNILTALFLAYIIGSFITLPLVFLGRKKLKSQIPFGTFLTTATYITLLYGDEIMKWYFKLSF